MRISDWSSDVWSSDLLGGSQAGARLAYAIDPAPRLQLVGRVATPLRGRGREAAIGVAWQPTRAPVRVVAEQRFAIDGGRGGPAIGVIGGVGPADRTSATSELQSLMRSSYAGYCLQTNNTSS